MLLHKYSGLITKGLGLPASVGLITMHFDLFVSPILPPVTGGGGGGGGGHVPVKGRGYNTAPSPRVNINPPRSFVRPYTTEPRRLITLRVNFNGHQIERFFEVPAERADAIIKIVGLASAARGSVTVTVKQLTNIADQVNIDKTEDSSDDSN